MEKDILNGIWPEWKISNKIGQGSYGVVYEAVRSEQGIESRAAIKIISIPGDESEIDTLRSEGMTEDMTQTYLQNVVDEFVKEIRIMQEFKGTQNIVSVEDYKVVRKTTELGWDIFIRMELLTPFNTYISDRTLSEEEIIRLGIDICSALELCAGRHIIHRDIKPENIFVNQFGNFKLGDFGIARSMENLTGSLSCKGTFNYMAPEVANGGSYNETADIYSLGLVLYRLTNKNRLPFLDTEKQLLSPGERAEAVRRRLAGEKIYAPCDASPDLSEVILAALEADPSKRFQNAAAMKHALQSVKSNKITPSAKGAHNESEVPEEKKEGDSSENRTASGSKPSGPNRVVSENISGKKGAGTAGRKSVRKKTIPIVIAAVVVAAVVIVLIISGINGERENKKREEIAQAVLRVEEYLENEDYSSASSVLDELEETYSGDASIAQARDQVNAARMMRNARTHLENGEYDLAASVLDELEEEYKDTVDSSEIDELRSSIETAAAVSQIRSYLLVNDTESADTLLLQMEEKYPDSEEFSEVRKELSDYNTVKNAQEHLDNGDYENAEKLLNSLENVTSEVSAQVVELNSIISDLKALEQINALIDAGKYDDADMALLEIELASVTNLIGNRNGGKTTAGTQNENIRMRITQTRERLDAARALAEADSYLTEPDYDNALAVLSEALEKYPENISLSEKKLEVQYEQRAAAVLSAISNARYDEAESLLRELSADFPGREGISALKDQLQIAKYISDIEACLDTEDYEQAEAILKEAEQQYPEDIALAGERTKIEVAHIVERADELIASGQYEQAEVLLDDSMEEYPEELFLKREQEVLELCRAPRYLVQYLMPWRSENYYSYVNGAYFEIDSMDKSFDESYTNGFACLEGSEAEAWFNLQGKYDLLSFDVIADGESNAVINNSGFSVEVYIGDSKIPDRIIQVSSFEPEHVEIPLNGADYFHVIIDKPHYGTFGFADIQLTSSFETAKKGVFIPTLKSNQSYLVDLYPVESEEFREVFMSGTAFSMCGADYSNGFILSSGGGFCEDVFIELDDEYSMLDLDAGYINKTYAGTLMVYLDEHEIPAIQAQSSSTGYVKHYSASLDGVKTIRFHIDDVYAEIGVANVVLTR